MARAPNRRGSFVVMPVTSRPVKRSISVLSSTVHALRIELAHAVEHGRQVRGDQRAPQQVVVPQ